MNTFLNGSINVKKLSALILKTMKQEFMLIYLKDTFLIGLTNIQSAKNCHGSSMMKKYGEMAERFKAHAWKACKGETLSWVRIPFSPPEKSLK